MRDLRNSGLLPVNMFDSLFSDMMPVVRGVGGAFTSFPIDIKENETAYTAEMNVPGFKKEDIDISLDNGVMTIKSEKEESSEKKEDGKYIVKERSVSNVSRSFHIPENVDTSKIVANMEDGVLKIVLPKAEKKDTSTKVQIN